MALPLFAATLFVSAFILFLVQPMIGKLILPKLGGTPQVWNTCMVFFQMVLLAGYAYTHTVSTRLKLRHQLIIHGILLLLPLAILLPTPFNVGNWVPDLGVNPTVDGKLIRLNLPPLSEERRKKLVALVKEKAETAKIAIRNVRRDSNKHADTAVKGSDLTEDDLRKLKDEIQEQTKEHEAKVDEFLKSKIDELMAV